MNFNRLSTMRAPQVKIQKVSADAAGATFENETHKI